MVNATKVLIGTYSTEQARAYSEIEKLWKNRTLFWVATPYGQFNNMAIESLTATQGENSNSISDFSITFKQVKFTQVVIDARTISERANDSTSFVGGE
jgi:cystathionine beta-lyase family protein involved in aluminum resistance